MLLFLVTGQYRIYCKYRGSYQTLRGLYSQVTNREDEIHSTIHIWYTCSLFAKDVLQYIHYFISIDETGSHIHPTLLAQSDMVNKVKSRSYTNLVKNECQCW